MGFFDKLKAGLAKTKQLLQTDIRDLLKAGEILDEPKLVEFEKRLLRTDMGVDAADAILEELRLKHLGRTVVLDEIWQTVKEKLKSLLRGDGNSNWDVDNPLSPLKMSSTKPMVMKLAKFLMSTGKTVVLAAGDTFRAAAVEQLTLWSQRLGCDIVTKPSGTDPASVAFAGCEHAINTGKDIVIVDTAGRLQTSQNLMQELTKIHRVIGKKIEGAPHESLLVLDATTGQNGLSQAKNFSDATQCTGLILAKLDGTAKGGVAVAIRQQMGIPVKYVGVGEGIDDLQVFSPDSFVDALFA
ncbi:MAG: fused signal recognition particle receptor [Planctomycetota bacterium]|nr:MAG: fused signal recognition particle receptor [Planctomycetota bacterium]